MSDRVDAQMLADWRINYNLVGRTPAEAMRWWHDHMDGKAPAGAVAALGLCIDEIERLTAERDELRRQLDPMGEYTSADELIAALRAEKAEDEAMKLDAQRYRWLRPRGLAADFAYGDPPVCAIVFRWPESAKISADFDRSIDAAMGASNE